MKRRGVKKGEQRKAIMKKTRRIERDFNDPLFVKIGHHKRPIKIKHSNMSRRNEDSTRRIIIKGEKKLIPA